MTHIPVLLDQVLIAMKAHEGGRFLDCTFGGGGHTRAILEANPSNQVVALDRDARAVERAKDLKANFAERFSIYKMRFGQINNEKNRELISGKFKAVLADFGMSTFQINEQRGFSFKDDQALDMRMDADEDRQNAQDIINNSSEKELLEIFWKGGVAKDAKAFCRAIIKARPVTSAKQLARIIDELVPVHKRQGAHPATVVFQALRIAVNQEFEEIEALIKIAPGLVEVGGRLALISFHSLEDKIVAQRMRKWEQPESMPANWPGINQRAKSLGRMLSKKAIRPSEAEIESNPASRSALLRVFEFSVI